MPYKPLGLSLLGSLSGVALMLSGLHPAYAVTYEEGNVAFLKKDYETAMRLWQPLAGAGDVRAQLGVAKMYYAGLGVARDYERAFEWCSLAANQGDANALYVLGAMYRDGKGVERDADKALSHSLKAANGGIPGAQYNVGLMYLTGEAGLTDYAQAYFWLGLAAAAEGKEYTQLRATAAFARDDAAAKLSGDEVADARRRIDTWKPASLR